MVERLVANENTGVRFSSPALKESDLAEISVRKDDVKRAREKFLVSLDPRTWMGGVRNIDH